MDEVEINDEDLLGEIEDALGEEEFEEEPEPEPEVRYATNE